jgi:hypothetical protein
VLVTISHVNPLCTLYSLCLTCANCRTSTRVSSLGNGDHRRNVSLSSAESPRATGLLLIRSANPFSDKRALLDLTPSRSRSPFKSEHFSLIVPARRRGDLLSVKNVGLWRRLVERCAHSDLFSWSRVDSATPQNVAPRSNSTRTRSRSAASYVCIGVMFPITGTIGSRTLIAANCLIHGR